MVHIRSPNQSCEQIQGEMQLAEIETIKVAKNIFQKSIENFQLKKQSALKASIFFWRKHFNLVN